MNRSQAIALTAAGLTAAPLTVRAQSNPKIRIGMNPGESLSEGLLAQGGGFFTRAGLDVELRDGDEWGRDDRRHRFRERSTPGRATSRRFLPPTCGASR